MNSRLRKAVLAVLFAVTVGLALVDRPPPADPAPVPRANTATQFGPGGSAPNSAGAEAKSVALPGRPELGESRAELFAASSWQPPPAPVVAAPAPVAPPLPYRFAGQLIQGERPQIYLARGDTVIAVGKGDTLDGAYRVESIGETEIKLLYLPLKQVQSVPVFGVLRLSAAAGDAPPAAAQGVAAISVTASAGTPGALVAAQRDAGAAPAPASNEPAAGLSTKPARLLWDGPERVKLGSPFSVALKVTSEQPVRASPMRLKFDPSVLETLAVRPGRFFGQGGHNFSYRVNPEGSIFVGAFNQGPESTAADAEFLVLTFKPLKSAPVAELGIASLSLQGPAGRTIAFDTPVTFKTAITP